MSAYDFSRLSSVDFEELIHDLLEAEWQLKLEAFASGRDGGIDLRYIAAGGSTIVQCKHFAGSGFAKLLSHLRTEERPKIVALAPQRYVVVTSVGLTPQNKDQIVAALSPFVCSPALAAQPFPALVAEPRLLPIVRRFPRLPRRHAPQRRSLQSGPHMSEHSGSSVSLRRKPTPAR